MKTNTYLGSHALVAAAANVVLFAFIWGGCVDTESLDFPDAGGSPDARVDLGGPEQFIWPDLPPQGDYTVNPINAKMYAHSKNELFSLAPGDLKLTKVGDFHPNGPDINDLAITTDGTMYALSINDLYKVDPKTAKLTHVTAVKGTANVSLTFEKTGKILLAADKQGDLRSIAFSGPNAGTVTTLGNYGDGQTSSGDLVGISDGTLFDTTDKGKGATKENNKLVIVDQKTGRATPICSVGHGQVWGLAFWLGTIYGFTKDGKLLRIKLTRDELRGQWVGCTTAPVEKKDQYSHEFWGAAVTPLAPIK